MMEKLSRIDIDKKCGVIERNWILDTVTVSTKKGEKQVKVSWNSEQAEYDPFPAPWPRRWPLSVKRKDDDCPLTNLRQAVILKKRCNKFVIID